MSKKKYIIGIDIGGTRIKSALLNKEAEIFFKKSIKTKTFVDAISIFKDIDLLIKKCEEKAWDRSGVISGIGIILPGYPDDRGSVSFIPNIPNLKNFPIIEYLHKDRDIPVIIENDGNASAYGEYIFGQKKKFKNIIVLTLGTGIGSGVVIGGKILRGRNKISGELGHLTLNSRGPICVCGKKGCLEAYFSGYAIKNIAMNVVHGKNNTTLKNYKLDELEPSIVASEAKKGDWESKQIFNYCGKWLGIGISIFINIFNPDKVILAGGIARSSKLFTKSMMVEVKKNIHPQYYNNINIKISRFTNNLGIKSTVSSFVD